MRIFLALTMVMVLCADVGRTWAQSASQKAIAEQLFQDARALMAQKNYEEAVPKLLASLDLARGSGTLGSLAVCYEQLGKLASAWVHYKEASAQADREGNPSRANAARAAAAALEPRLPRLTIVASSNAVPGLVLDRDGNELTPAMLGIAVYVDPGEHNVTATAPGYQPFSSKVTLTEKETVTVEIPTLSPIPKPVPDDKPTISSSSGQPEMRVRSDADDQSNAEDPGRSRRMAGLLTGGAGAAVLTVGLIVGATVFSAWNSPFDSNQCDRDTLICTPEGQSQAETARSRANLSNLLVGTGAATVAAGVVLYFTAPRNRQKHRDTARIVPIVEPDSLGVVLVGGF